MRGDALMVNHSSAIGTKSHGLPTPTHDLPSSGFTAVNGETSRNTSFRPDNSAQSTRTTDDGNQHNPAPPHSGPNRPSHDSRGWRSDERNGTVSEREIVNLESPASNKRKRTETNGTGAREDSVERVPHGLPTDSPKRRMTAPNSDGRARSSNNRKESEDSDLEPATAANNVRAPSPIYRAGHGTPPPPPTRESEDALAKSLQATLGSRNNDDSRHVSQSVSPEVEGNGDALNKPHNADAAQQGENGDSKKRKRNFSNRTKTGCHTCRSRKKKCDEGKPLCENCKRGGFDCGGYGPKPPGSSKVSTVRSVVPLQAKNQYDYPQGPGHFFEPHHRPPQPQPVPPPPTLPHHLAGSAPPHAGPIWEGPRQEAYNSQQRYGPPQPMPPENRPPAGHDPWASRPQWPTTDPSITYVRERLPPVDFAGVPSSTHGYPADRQPPGDPWRAPQGPMQYRTPPAPPTVISTHSSASGRTLHHLPTIPMPGANVDKGAERMKMLTGQPYLHYIDDTLRADRASCKRAVEGYNNACAASSTANGPEKERHFQMILDPMSRDYSESHRSWNGPVGECGAQTFVEAPFTCEFGYNIKLGSGILISANCVIEDASLVSIGDRTIVGKNVKFHCMTASVDASSRNGSQGPFIAGAIVVEEDCMIGADSIILPFRTIGKGAVVGAGSVVTRDVKPYTVVAGNPAKPIRKRKIESGPNVDRHDDIIQEENERMLDMMRKRPLTRDRIP